MLNNKGQSLVVFVMIIPIFLLLFIIVIDVGNMYLVRRELDNINHITLDYGINNISNEDVISKMTEIIYKNDQDIKITTNKIENNKIYLAIEKEYNGYFLSLINKSFTNIKSSYVGYLDNEKEYIERVQ